ncbi:hypothetical protein B0H13DRAFT_2101971 [Mycena leptocephala]|nr:hypothetical protein B0H13DRAFT_2101971 [Mycena leptocephala]
MMTARAGRIRSCTPASPPLLPSTSHARTRSPETRARAVHPLRYRHPSSTPIPISSCARLYTSTTIKVDVVDIRECGSCAAVEEGKNGEEGGGKWRRPRSAREAGRQGSGERRALPHGHAHVAQTCSPRSHAGQRESGKGTAWPGGREGRWEGEGGPRTARQAAKWVYLRASVSHTQISMDLAVRIRRGCRRVRTARAPRWEVDR